MLQYRHCIRIEVGSRVEFICHQYCAFALITVVVVGVHTGLVAKIQVWNCSAGVFHKALFTTSVFDSVVVWFAIAHYNMEHLACFVFSALVGEIEAVWLVRSRRSYFGVSEP